MVGMFLQNVNSMSRATGGKFEAQTDVVISNSNLTFKSRLKLQSTESVQELNLG